MNFIKKRKISGIFGICLILVCCPEMSSGALSPTQSVQDSLEKVTKILEEKSEKLLKRREETEQILAALLEFSRTNVQRSLLFSSPQEYTRISLLLENLAQKGQESLLDLNQEIAELNVLVLIRKEQEKKLLQAS